MISNYKRKRIIYLNSKLNNENILTIEKKIDKYLNSIDYKIVNYNININIRKNNYPELSYKIVKSIDELTTTKEKVIKKNKDKYKVIKKMGLNPKEFKISEFIVEVKEKNYKNSYEYYKGEEKYDEDRIMRDLRY